MTLNPSTRLTQQTISEETLNINELKPPQPTFPLLTFPADLLYTNAETLDPQTLHSLSQANHHLSALLAPLLNKAFIKNRVSIFLRAAKRNSGPLMKRAVAAGATIPRMPGGQTLRQVSAIDGWDETARIALDLGSSPDTINCQGYSALIYAAGTRRLHIVWLILECGGDPNLEDAYLGQKPMYKAGLQGDVELVKLLLEHGADPNQPSRPTHPGPGYEGTRRGERYERTFRYAVRSGKMAIVKPFLEHGVDLEDKYCGGYTPLHYAARFAGVEMVDMMLRYGADINAKGRCGYTALHVTVLYSGRDEVRELLLKEEIDINGKSARGYTALHLAVCRGNVSAVKMLLAYGADIGTVGLHVWWPVRARAWSERDLGSIGEVRRALLEYGAILKGLRL